MKRSLQNVKNVIFCSIICFTIGQVSIYSSLHGLLWTGKYKQEQLVGSAGGVWVSGGGVQGRIMYQEKNKLAK